MASDEKPIELPPAQPSAETQAAQPQPTREKTGKETLLDTLIAKRQSILDALKEKNPKVAQARRQIATIIPSLRGKGSSHTLALMREEEKLEFSIATEAYTPKKEKELIKRLREIRAELSKNKEVDAARKKVESERSLLNSLLAEVKSLEAQLSSVRKECDSAYSEVLAERKAAYESMQAERRGRQLEQEHQREERQRRDFEGLRARVKGERKREMDAEMAKYMKDYDDTVSMDEIVVIEKKERKEKKEGDEAQQ